ncbi:MAG: hypothetical protein NEA02_04830 [Thermoanaerobaculia bacterium]|nr:hypothetical protein [Thermoanaerobaculia bacterium]
MRPTVLAATSGLLAVFLCGSAGAQNLLTNADFSLGLAGWGVTATVDPGSEASVTVVPEDAGGDDVPAAVKFHLRMGPPNLEGWLLLGQCRAIQDDRPLAFGARVRVDRQVRANLFVSAAFYENTQCVGSRFGATSVKALPSSGGVPLSSNGRWLFVSGVAEPPPGMRAVVFALQVDEFAPTSAVEFDGLIDDAYLTSAGAQNNLWVVPSVARTPGLNGNLWTSNVTLANSGSVDGLATLKFLGNGVDGRAGTEQTVYLPAGHLVELRDVLGGVFAGPPDFGALRILATPGISVVSETSTPSPNGGSVGESLPAAGPGDLVGLVPRSLFPVRENEAFRTNLHLANATESEIVVEVRLVAPNGAQVGHTAVTLLAPLEMLQLNRVVTLLGVNRADAGRLTVSTTTPGALVAAYASVIDNITNDPRTILPR